MFAAVLKEIRIRQYTKNAFVFAAPVFAGKLFQGDIFFYAVLSFIAFSLIASAVYVGNDLLDIEKDRKHPVKRSRPIAAGVIPITYGIALFVILLAAALALACFINMSFLVVLIMYFVMNAAYSLKLKHIVIVDVMIIAFGFVLRAFAGVIVAGSGATTWFILCIFMLSLFLALAKRRGELLAVAQSAHGITRLVLQKYSVELLNMLIVVVCAIMLTSYALFSSSVTDVCIHGIPLMLFTFPLVVYGSFRYLYILMVCGDGEAPEEIFLKDKGILLTVSLYVISIVLIRDV